MPENMSNPLSLKIDQYFTKDKKGFGFGEDAVHKFIIESFKKDSETSDQIKLSESLAFAFRENRRYSESPNETYFCPIFTGIDENENRIESPSLVQITPEMIGYWEARGIESPNPILRARYLGLVWHLKKLKTNQKPDFKIAQGYLDALIDIADGDYYNPPLYTYSKLEHGLDLAIKFKDEARINAFVRAIIEFEKRHAEDDKAGTWGKSFDLLFDKKGISLTSDEEQSIVLDLESLLIRLENVTDTRGVELCAKRLAKYYLKYNRAEDARNVILRVGAITYKSLNDDSKDYTESTVSGDGIKTINLGRGSAIQYIHSLEDLLKLYHEFNITDFDDEIMISIREKEPEILKLMMPVSSKVSFPQEVLDNDYAMMSSGTKEEIISKLIIRFIPDTEDAKNHLSESSSTHTLLSMLTKTEVDYKGRAVAKLGSICEDPSGQLISQISQSMQLQSLFLDMTLNKLFDEGKLSAEDIFDYLKDSPFIETDRHEIIKRGLEAFSKGDFIVSIHLLIPQIENAIRNIVAQTGGNIYQQNRSDGYDLKIFDTLLREPNIESILNGELAQYFRTLFTDRRGWNLRNKVCHGMLPDAHFSMKEANRVIHALLCIGALSFEPQA